MRDPKLIELTEQFATLTLRVNTLEKELDELKADKNEGGVILDGTSSSVKNYIAKQEQR